MTNLKDVIHLYIGCEVKKSNKTEDDIVDTYALTPEVLWYAIEQEDKPLLRPLSDMTDEETRQYKNIRIKFYSDNECEKNAARFQWLLSRHFDLFGLIESGQALDKTKEVAV